MVESSSALEITKPSVTGRANISTRLPGELPQTIRMAGSGAYSALRKIGNMAYSIDTVPPYTGLALPRERNYSNLAGAMQVVLGWSATRPNVVYSVRYVKNGIDRVVVLVWSGQEFWENDAISHLPKV